MLAEAAFRSRKSGGLELYDLLLLTWDKGVMESRQALVLLLLAALTGCGDGRVSEKELDDVSGIACPNSLKELAEQVFRPSCVDGGCHGSTDRAGGLDLQTSVLERELFGREAALCPGEIRIVPGDAARSHLIAKLRGTSDCGGPMPIGVALDPETIDCVAAWIDQLDVWMACETCGGTACVDLQTDTKHCGSCGRACDGEASCLGGRCVCSETLSPCASGCVDLESDPQNCGSCGMDCGDKVCFGGECLADCGALTGCDGACVDLLNDSNNCGACGEACGPGTSCFDGQCQCGSVTVSFAADVQPIFSASCASMGCHGGASGAGRPGDPRAGGSSLDLSLGSAYQSLMETTTTCGAVVVSGDPEASLLIGKLTGTALCTGSQMPKGDAPLAPELIDTIAGWICQGAEDN